MAAEWGVPTFRTAATCWSADRPDFVIVSVPWPVTPGATRELVAAGVPVLAETPPAPDLDGLRALWADVGGAAWCRSPSSTRGCRGTRPGWRWSAPA